MNTLKLSPLAKALIPILSASVLMACNDNSSDTKPVTEIRDNKVVISPSDMPTETYRCG